MRNIRTDSFHWTVIRRSRDSIIQGQIEGPQRERSAWPTILTTLSLLIGYALSQTMPANAQQTKKNNETLEFDTTENSITVFPIALGGELSNMSKDVADVIGLMLEQAAVQKIETLDTPFRAPTGSGLEETGPAFAEFVKTNRIKTDYAIYGEFLGSPETGVKEVRTFIADKSGNLIWCDSQTPKDAAFKRINPRNPMTCCVLMAERLRCNLGLKESNEAPKGKMAKLWEQKSALPPESERSAMSNRQEMMKKTAKTARLTIFPVRIGSESSEENAKHLAELLQEDKALQVKVSNKSPDLQIKGSSNEQRVLWDMARAFRDYVRNNPSDTEYTLYADYMIARKIGEKNEIVRAVHFAVCDPKGEWVIVDFQNDYQADFKSVKPKSKEDCDRLVVRRLKSYLE